MTVRSRQLARERARLQQRAARQRQDLQVVSRELGDELDRVERAIDIARRVATSPLFIGAALALLVVGGARRGLLRRLPAILMTISAVRRLARPRH
jgi:hypothetical protein